MVNTAIAICNEHFKLRLKFTFYIPYVAKILPKNKIQKAFVKSMLSINCIPKAIDNLRRCDVIVLSVSFGKWFERRVTVRSKVTIINKASPLSILGSLNVIQSVLRDLY